MKKNFLSPLLLFALTLGATSTFASCKDYDDDINGLREQINNLASKDDLASKAQELQDLVNANKDDIAKLTTDLQGKTTLDAVKAL